MNPDIPVHLRIRAAVRGFFDPLSAIEAAARAEAAKHRREPVGVVSLLVFKSETTLGSDGTMGHRTDYMLVPVLPMGLPESDLPGLLEGAARAHRGQAGGVE